MDPVSFLKNQIGKNEAQITQFLPVFVKKGIKPPLPYYKLKCLIAKYVSICNTNQESQLSV
jgi:hypothetical protein